MKEFCSAEKFILSILASFYYNNYFSLTYSTTDFTYSDIPFVDPSGVNFDFLYPIHNNLINKVNINNKTGQLLFYNYIDISQYSLNILYNYNKNTTITKFNLIVKPLFTYNESVEISYLFSANNNANSKLTCLFIVK